MLKKEKRKYEKFKYEKLVSIEANKKIISERDISCLISFAKSKDPIIRSWVAELLVNKYTKQSEETLYHMTFDRKDIVRLNAVDSLCIGKHLKSLQRLKSLFKDDDYLIRGYAISSHFDVSMNIYGRKFNANNKYVDLMKKLLKSEASPWVEVSIYHNMYLCGLEAGLGKIAYILEEAAQNGDFEVVWCVLHTLDELLTQNNEVFIRGIIKRVYPLLLDVQKDYIKENIEVSLI